MRDSLHLSIKALDFCYAPDQVVFEALDLKNLPIGRTALMGPSGVGKTTFLKLMTGILRPSRGEICVGPAREIGRDPSRISAAYVSQEDSLLPWLTVAGSISLARRLIAKNLTPLKDEDVQAKVVSDLGLADRLEALPYELSGGMRRRAALAASLLSGADLFILDEPFAGSDFVKRSSMYQAIKAATRADQADLMFTTHDPIDAIELASQVVWIAGHTTDKLTVLDARQGWTEALRAQLSTLMLGRQARD